MAGFGERYGADI